MDLTKLGLSGESDGLPSDLSPEIADKIRKEAGAQPVFVFTEVFVWVREDKDGAERQISVVLPNGMAFPLMSPEREDALKLEHIVQQMVDTVGGKARLLHFHGKTVVKEISGGESFGKSESEFVPKN